MILGCKPMTLSGVVIVSVLSPLEASAFECEPELPELAVFDQHIANRGQARNAYQLAAKNRGIANQSCACPYADWPFEQFIENRLDKPADELTELEIRGLRQWSDVEGVSILRAYSAFFAEYCAVGD